MCLRRLGIAFTLTVGIFLCSATGAAAIERFSGTLHGGVVATGNSLGLSKGSNVNGPGTLDSIGTFMADGSILQDGTYPVGTTGDWTLNRSSANLSLPAGATVVHAELIWGGSYQYGAEDVSGLLDSAVSFRFGASDATLVSPDPATSVTLSGMASDASPFRYYTRTADVTAIVAGRGAGTYSLGGVPATQTTNTNSSNAAGWTLAVAYRHAAAPMRWVGLGAVSGFVDDMAPLDETMDGFCVPETGAPAGSLVASAMEGDANRTGDQMLAGADVGSLEELAGTNNLVTNFFASQINGSNGAIDTTGTFGSSNHDPVFPANVSAGRQGWDVTTVPLGDQLVNGQSELLVRAATTDDTYVPTMFGAQIDVNAPKLDVTGGSLAPASIAPGGTTTLTVPISNLDGDATAEDVALRLTLPPGVSLSSFTIDNAPGDASGNPVTASELAAGADVGDIPIGATRVVRIVTQANSAGTFQFAPKVGYAWKMCADSDLSLGDDLTAPTRSVTVADPPDPPDPPDPDTVAPKTTITLKPPNRTTKSKVRFKFKSNEPGSKFECSLDKAKFKSCKSPKVLRASRGKHRFRVRAVDASGNKDGTPATSRFRVVKKRN